MQKESLIKKSAILHETEVDEAIHLTTSVREPLPTIQTYCQSKTFIAHFGINGLVACASALFSLLSKLRNTTQYVLIDKLKEDLIHEIKAFECAALHRGYTEQKIIVARYAICATLDEVILQTAWGRASEWHTDTLLYTFQGEMWGGERLFAILERLREGNHPHTDLLEFIYLCLSLGFEGKYRINPKDKDSFYHILDATYHIIKNFRGDTPEKLCSLSIKTPPSQPEKKSRSFLKEILLISCGSIMLMYLLFLFFLQEASMPVLNHVQQIIHSMPE